MLFFKRQLKLLTFAFKSVRNSSLKESILKKDSYINININQIIRMSTSISVSHNDNSKIVNVYNNIIKPTLDKREYRGLELNNGMKCLLISDPTTDKSAASVDVHIGLILNKKNYYVYHFFI
jgi:hypothetical protein